MSVVIILEMEALFLKNPDSAEADTAPKTLRKIFHDAKKYSKNQSTSASNTQRNCMRAFSAC